METEEAALGAGAEAGTRSIVLRGQGLDHLGILIEITMIDESEDPLGSETVVARDEEEELRAFLPLIKEDGTAVRKEEIKAEDPVPDPGTKRLNPNHHPSKKSFSNLPKAAGLELKNLSETLRN